MPRRMRRSEQPEHLRRAYDYADQFGDPDDEMTQDEYDAAMRAARYGRLTTLPSAEEIADMASRLGLGGDPFSGG